MPDFADCCPKFIQYRIYAQFKDVFEYYGRKYILQTIIEVMLARSHMSLFYPRRKLTFSFEYGAYISYGRSPLILQSHESRVRIQEGTWNVVPYLVAEYREMTWLVILYHN